LVTLAGDKSPVVRGAAAGGLARLRVDTKETPASVTGAALEKVLKTPDTSARQAAASALSGLLRPAPAADQGGIAAQVAPISPLEVIDFGQQVAHLAGGAGLPKDADYKGGLADRDAGVRRLSADALLLATTKLAEQLTVAGTTDTAEAVRKRL